MSLSGADHPVNGPSAMSVEAAHRYLDKIIEICDIFGINTLGGGYGRLETKYSRYNKAVSFDEVKKFVVGNLKELDAALRVRIS